jgi:hypothetical protein
LLGEAAPEYSVLPLLTKLPAPFETPATKAHEDEERSSALTWLLVDISEP